MGAYSGTVSRRAQVRQPPGRVWKKLSDITGMAGWALGVSSCAALPGPRRGVGARRTVRFADGRSVEEHFTDWHRNSYTYAAVSGLGLRAYVATMSVEPSARGSSVAWRSYMASGQTTRARFEAARSEMGEFYSGSLRALAGALG